MSESEVHASLAPFCAIDSVPVGPDTTLGVQSAAIGTGHFVLVD